MRQLLIAGLLLLAGTAQAQDCGRPADNAPPSNAAYLKWQPVTEMADGKPLVLPVYYVVYETTTSLEGVRVCRTSSTDAAITNLSNGVHTWVVAALINHPDGRTETSGPSNPWSKTIGVVTPPPVASRLPARPVLTGQ